MELEHRRLNILFIGHDLGFPNGFASTQRMRLVAKALALGGASPRILLTRVSERPDAVTNTQVEGQWQGVPFRYATGATVRSNNFVNRRVADLRGVAGAVASLIEGRRTGNVDCVYLWMHPNWIPFRLLRSICALLGLPVVHELSEPTRAVWNGAALSEGAGDRDPLLNNVSGFVIISSGLEQWVRTRKDGARPRIMRLPVLVDTDEMKPSFVRAARRDVFYAGTREYPDEIEFVLDAMQLVREQYPDVRVRFSGWRIADVARSSLQDRLRALVRSGSSVVEGVMPREGLLEAYRQCALLLLPMKDEPRSLARCPTKLGEYLASGRPVVATGIGEISALLSNGKNAFLAEPGSVRSFTNAILAALEEPNRADAVGCGGRALAEQVLDYRAYALPLCDFFASVSAASGDQVPGRHGSPTKRGDPKLLADRHPAREPLFAQAEWLASGSSRRPSRGPQGAAGMDPT